MSLSAAISRSLVKAIVTFDMVNQKIFFFSFQSFDLMKHQKLMSAVVSRFQQGSTYRATSF